MTGQETSLRIRSARPDEVPVLQAIEKAARSRYRALPGFEFAASTPVIAPARFKGAESLIVAEEIRILGFILLERQEDTLYLANISVEPRAAGRGLGTRLISHAMKRVKKTGARALTLTTFRAPPWNGPWFRRQGFEEMPEEEIGTVLRAVLQRHATFLDMSTREVLWRCQ